MNVLSVCVLHIDKSGQNKLRKKITYYGAKIDFNINSSCQRFEIYINRKLNISLN